MTTFCYSIVGGDYDRAGAACRGLKELLKTLGVGPEALRRIMIAAYEAEMNVVIHAHRGVMLATPSPGVVQVEVTDEGPGIQDIALALTPGYSTAPAKARQLGFGAGLGLPNIQKNSDSFVLESDPGKGTRLRFSVELGPCQTVSSSRNSLRLSAELCSGCLRCVRSCPMQALRLYHDEPRLLPHLCIDCLACIEQCPTGALALESPSELSPAAGRLLLSASFLSQFEPDASQSQVLWALEHLGFESLYYVEPWESIQRKSALSADRADNQGPVLLPVCPSVINLIETRFGSLLSRLIPYYSPLEAAALQLGAQNLSALVLCPAQRSALLELGVRPERLIVPRGLRKKVLDELRKPHPEPSPELPRPRVLVAKPPWSVLRIGGIGQVIRVLDELESGGLGELRVLELYACELGCIGSALLHQSPYVTLYRQRFRQPPEMRLEAKTQRRSEAFELRPGLRLDKDMRQAITKLGQISELARTLAGKDCASCGAPSCRAHAEDVVLGRIRKAQCVHQTGRPV